MRRTIRDLMSKDVIVVLKTTPFKELVDLMAAKGVSALPVVDPDGHLAGIVSEADLLMKEEHPGHGAKRHRLEIGRGRVEHEKAAGTVAQELMTTNVVSIGPDATPGEAARLMHDKGVKRLPVVEETGSVIGIVSRKDILEIFLRSDDELRRELIHDVFERKLWLTPEEADIRVTVERGVVTLEGTIDRKSMLEIIVAMTYGLEGVVGVNNRMRFQTDDTKIHPERTLPWGVLPWSLRRP